MDIKKLTKKGLEDLGRKFGLELDRRLKKDKLVAELEEHTQSLSKNELEDLGREQGIELDRRKSSGSLIKEVANTGLIDSYIKGPFSYIDGKLTKDGELLKFKTAKVANAVGGSEDGYAIQVDDYFVVKSF